MATFPTLKTGAVAQYPATREVVSNTRVLKFVDGGEQRIRRGRRHSRWVIELELLDEGELARLAQFVESVQGGHQEFAFTDPWTGLVYPRCRLEGDDITMNLDGGHRGQARVVIAEAAD